MASFKSPRKKFQAKYERAPQFQKLFYMDILQSQQTDAHGEIADTKLVCHGGTIRVHAFILQAASPFIQNAIASQGENYPFVREILIPDFPVKEIENMLSLIYKGYVDLRNEKEVQSLQETLKFFQVSSVDFSSEKGDRIQGSIKVESSNKFPPDLYKKEIKDDSAGLKPKVIVTESPSLRRSGRPHKPLVKLGTDDVGSNNDPDYKPGSGDDSSVEELSEDETKKRRKPQMKQAVIKLPRINEEPSAKPTSGSRFSSKSTTPASTPGSSIKSASNTPKSNGKNKDEDSGTDSEDEDWESPDFKDKSWFNRESRRCQSCNKVYDRAAEASLCVTSHKCLRCYFCFRVYSTTDILFKHFKRRHKQAGRENTLICPFCDQAIPYKSVSCHVISVHLRTKSDNDTNQGGIASRMITASCPSTPKSNEVRKGPGRPASTLITSSGSRAPRRRSRSMSTERVEDKCFTKCQCQ